MDPLLLLSQVLLFALGANAVAVSAPELLPGHLLRLALAFFATLVAARIPLSLWVRGGLLLYLATLMLLVLTLFVGEEINGARRWINLGGFSLQPSEFAKLFLILYLARYLARHGTDHPIFGPVTLIGLGVAAVALEPDFAGALFLLLIAFLLFLAVGVPLRRILAIGVATGFVALATQGLYLSRFQHVLERIRAFMHEGGAAYQIARAKEAILAGGLLGQGPGAAMPYVPYAYNDMAFAALAFALGAVGVLLLFSAYTLVLGRGLQIAARTEGATSVVALGVTTLIVVAATLHVAVVLGLLPPTGLPLPLVSYGGSAALAFGLAFGLLHRAARETHPAPAKEGE